MSDRQITVDVVVVGARCAGAATAMLLARSGLEVLLLDRAHLPRDTTSTHALSRGGLVLLKRWGLLDAIVEGGAPPVRSVTFCSVHARSVPPDVLRLPVKDRAGVDFLLAPRRWALDASLAQAAVASGARLLTGVTVREVVRDAAGRVRGVTGHDDAGGSLTVRCRLVVGADGVRSRVAVAVGAALVRQHAPGSACLYSYVGGVDWDGFEFHTGAQSFGGVFPTHHDEACVWLVRPMPAAATMLAAGADRRRAWSAALAETLPVLADRVRGGVVTAPVRGAVGLPNHVRAASGPGWALVGDAGYHRDPITGHGITDAFRDAELLAESAGRWLCDHEDERRAMTQYAVTRDRALREIFTLTRALARFPPGSRFRDLQVRLGRAVDAEAGALADRRFPGSARSAA